MIMIVYQQLLDDVACFWILWNQFLKASSFLFRKVEFHVTCDLLKLVKQFFVGRADHIMYFVNLVELIGAWKERSQSQNLKEDAADSPVIHLMVVVSIRQEALRWPVPSRGDVLSERWLRINSST